jgi:hypothetical protein
VDEKTYMQFDGFVSLRNEFCNCCSVGEVGRHGGKFAWNKHSFANKVCSVAYESEIGGNRTAT